MVVGGSWQVHASSVASGRIMTNGFNVWSCTTMQWVKNLGCSRELVRLNNWTRFADTSNDPERPYRTRRITAATTYTTTATVWAHYKTVHTHSRFQWEKYFSTSICTSWVPTMWGNGSKPLYGRPLHRKCRCEEVQAGSHKMWIQERWSTPLWCYI